MGMSPLWAAAGIAQLEGRALTKTKRLVCNKTHCAIRSPPFSSLTTRILARL
jgi:hypothetical protein